MESSPCLSGSCGTWNAWGELLCVRHCCHGAQAVVGPGWEEGEGVSAEHGSHPRAGWRGGPGEACTPLLSRKGATAL